MSTRLLSSYATSSPGDYWRPFQSCGACLHRCRCCQCVATCYCDQATWDNQAREVDSFFRALYSFSEVDRHPRISAEKLLRGFVESEDFIPWTVRTYIGWLNDVS